MLLSCILFSAFYEDILPILRHFVIEKVSTASSVSSFGNSENGGELVGREKLASISTPFLS